MHCLFGVWTGQAVAENTLLRIHKEMGVVREDEIHCTIVDGLEIII